MIGKEILLVGLGGGIGSIFRYLSSILNAKYFQSAQLLATFSVNVLGCILIGIFLGLIEHQKLSNPNLKNLFITGFCGGFTTFSAFAAENMQLISTGNSFSAILYILSTIVFSLLGVFLGHYIIQNIS